jgi:predicted nucleic acid-binding protein
MAAQKKRLSLDANFLFDLAEEEDFAHDLLDVLQGKGYGLALPPTVAHELYHFYFAIAPFQSDPAAVIDRRYSAKSN